MHVLISREKWKISRLVRTIHSEITWQKLRENGIAEKMNENEWGKKRFEMSSICITIVHMKASIQFHSRGQVNAPRFIRQQQTCNGR